MVKKIAIVAVAVLAGLFLLNKTNLGSYAGLAWKKVRTSANNQVPLEFEIERVRHEVAKLGPDMRQHLSAIATEEVAVENLREDVSNTRAQLAKQKETVLTMKRDLAKADAGNVTYVTYGDRKWSVSRVRDKLARDWASYKRCEEGLQSKEKLLEVKEEALAAARDQLAAMKDKKAQLEVQVAQLEAELKTLRVAQTRSDFQLDDSRLARINASVAQIHDRLRILKKEQDLRGQFANDLEIPVEKAVKTADVIKEIDEHFGKDGKVAAGND
jgi:chromosome segregation ATPase